jgi:hypothetical protein
MMLLIVVGVTFMHNNNNSLTIVRESTILTSKWLAQWPNGSLAGAARLTSIDTIIEERLLELELLPTLLRRTSSYRGDLPARLVIPECVSVDDNESVRFMPACCWRCW